MATLKTVAGNTAPPLVITCQRDGTAIDLTGCTVQVIIARGATVTQAGGAAVVTTAASGIITYVPLATDFPTAGTYKGDVKVTYGDSTVEILYERLKVKARNHI